MKQFITYSLLLLSLAANAQHGPLVSQYMLNGLVTNPAYTGSREVFTANAMYRNQWIGIEGAPVTQIASLHAPLKNKSLALGILLNNEKIGVSNSTGVSGSFGYRIQMNRAKLSFGISAGMEILSARYSELTTTENNDNAFAADLRSNVQPDFGAGVYYSSKTYFVGLSVPSLVNRQYNISDQQLDIKSETGIQNIILQGGYLFYLTEEFKLKPSSLIRLNPEGNSQIDLNANLIYKDCFWIGFSYRHNEAVVGLLEFQINQQFRVAYAYDYALSIFRQYSSGSHEIGLQYEFGYKVNSVDPRFF